MSKKYIAHGAMNGAIEPLVNFTVEDDQDVIFHFKGKSYKLSELAEKVDRIEELETKVKALEEFFLSFFQFFLWNIRFFFGDPGRLR